LVENEFRLLSSFGKRRQEKLEASGVELGGGIWH
jgi:hypothetical protein